MNRKTIAPFLFLLAGNLSLYGLFKGVFYISTEDWWYALGFAVLTGSAYNFAKQIWSDHAGE